MWTSVIVLASICGQPEAPVNAVSGTARARIQIRHTVDVPAETLVPDLRAHLDAHGFQMVRILPVEERDTFLASRTDPDDVWVQRVVRSMALTCGRQPNVIPTNSASGPSEFFKAEATGAKPVAGVDFLIPPTRGFLIHSGDGGARRSRDAFFSRAEGPGGRVAE
jgi:acetylornithine deacetylase/succinyl-diaminopimelate desuccinylase-like protein